MQRCYLSIDIGGTAIKSALIDHSGNITTKKQLPTPCSKEQFLSVLLQIVKGCSNICAICISVPGIVNSATKEVQFTGALGFMQRFNLVQFLTIQTGLPVYVGNDANCATLAERWMGNLAGIDNGAVITLGTSVGGGIVINGQLLHGHHFRAGELSAMVNNYDHQIINSRTVGANTSAVRMIEDIAVACHLPNIKDGQAVFNEVNKHRPQAWDIFTRYCQRVAYLIMNLQSVLDLDTVLLGGGISAQPILISEIKNQFKKLQSDDRRLRDDIRMPQIKAAKFGNEANLLGSLYGFLIDVQNN